MFCSNCGSAISKNEKCKFCGKCGALVEHIPQNKTFHDKENINNDLFNVEDVNKNIQSDLEIDNTLIWILAFIPILGTVWKFGVVLFLVVNCLLTYFDESNLKKLGCDTTKLGNTWLIPVYLYNRAKMFDQDMGYFIVWCITFILSCI